MKLSNRVKEMRARYNMTQTDLAKAIGVSRQTISLIERGDYAPSVVLALKMSKVFHEPVETIFMLKTESPKEKREQQIENSESQPPALTLRDGDAKV